MTLFEGEPEKGYSIQFQSVSVFRFSQGMLHQLSRETRPARALVNREVILQTQTEGKTL